MELYRNWFVGQVSGGGSPPTFTVTTGGVRIDGVDVVAPESLLSLPAVRQRLDGLIAGIEPVSAGETARRRTAVRNQLLKLASDLRPLKEIAEKAIAAIEAINREVDAGGHADFTPLTSIDSEIQSYSGRTVVSFLMQEAISQIRSGFGSAGVREQIEASRQLYEGLLDSVCFHMQSIREVTSNHETWNYQAIPEE